VAGEAAAQKARWARGAASNSPARTIANGLEDLSARGDTLQWGEPLAAQP